MLRAVKQYGEFMPGPSFYETFNPEKYRAFGIENTTYNLLSFWLSI